ncbi:hypothetical protein [Microaceticoccus formicicus]|nr:hypothetical protein VZL98_01505 [Peptoniphilaceae bacterium AMB_02]
MNKRYVWNPKTWYQWTLYYAAYGLGLLGAVMLIWLMYVLAWASSI